MWNVWKSKLREFEKWRTERRRANMLQYRAFYRGQFVKEIPQALFEMFCLDIGCGSGGVLYRIVKEKKWIGIGIDPILELSLKVFHRKVREENLPVFLIQGVGEYLPLRDSHVHVAIATSTLDHLQDVDQTFQECHRVLKGCGHFYVLETVEKQAGKGGWTHLRSFTLNRLQNLFQKNGFKIKKMRFLYHLVSPRFLSQILSKLMQIRRLYITLGLMRKIVIAPRQAKVIIASERLLSPKANCRDI